MSKISRKDFIYIAVLFKEVLNVMDGYTKERAVEIFIRGLKKEYSNFDESKFRAYLKH
tara:strand:- start:1353 stop:1526 length:174 start_codon:yes stop_codon:yes gene_type:complete